MNGIIWYKCYKCYKLYNVISPWDPRHIPEAAKPQFAIGPQKCVVMGPVGELINAASVWTHLKIGIMRKESTKNLFRISSSNLLVFEFKVIDREEAQFENWFIFGLESKHHTNAILWNQSRGLALWIEDTEQLEPQGGLNVQHVFVPPFFLVKKGEYTKTTWKYICKMLLYLLICARHRHS